MSKSNLVTIYASCVLVCVSIGIADSATVNYDVSRAPDLEDFARRAKQQMEAWFDSIAHMLRSPNYKPKSTMLMYFDPTYDGIAKTEYWNARIVGSVNYYRKNQRNAGSMIHEMVHVIQSYKSNTPSWVWEGIADYIRYYVYTGEGNQKPTKPKSSQSYRDGYGVTAYFLNYVMKNVRNDMIYYVNKDAREGTYSDTIWRRLTGKDLNQLWNDMLSHG